MGAIAVGAVLLLSGKAFPAGLIGDVWAVFFLAEGGALLFARTRATLTVFPRLFALTYGALVAYLAASPYPFSSEAVNAWALAVGAALAHAVVAHEVPALRDGRIHFHRPRALLSRLPAPQPVAPASGALPPLWSTFLPLTIATPDEPERREGEGAGAYALPVPPLRHDSTAHAAPAP